jgi:hypothetical protein
MDMDVVNGFFGGETCIRLIVKLAACDDVRVDPRPGQMESEISENLASCGMVGKKEAVKKNYALHAVDRPGIRSSQYSSRYRIVARHMHSDCAAHYVEKDLDATGVIEPLQNAELFGKRTGN